MSADTNSRVERYGAKPGSSAWLALLVVPLCACLNEPDYAGNGTVYQVALTQNTAPAFTSRDGSIYIVERRVELQVARPGNVVLQDLRKGAAAYKNLPFPRLPWVGRDDLPMQVDFTLSNLDGQAHDVTVTLNGENEFNEYVPGVHVIDNQVQPDYAQWERSYTVQPKQRVSRAIREEELDEVAVDLATVVNGAPNANETVYFENKSGHDPRSDRYIPAVVPGLVGFRIGLRAQGAGKLLLEATVRARDPNARLTSSAATAMHFEPQPFTPMPPPGN